MIATGTVSTRRWKPRTAAAPKRRSRGSIRRCSAHPEGAEAHNGRGEILWDEGKIEEALHEFERSLHADPKFVTAHLNRAELVVEDLSEFERAVELCDELLAGKTELPRLDRATEAEVYYLKAKARLLSRRSRGRALPRAPRAQDRRRRLDLSRLRGPDPVRARALLGRQARLDAAIALDPDSGHAIYHMGLVLERLGSAEEAQRAFAKANALDPERYPCRPRSTRSSSARRRPRRSTTCRARSASTSRTCRCWSRISRRKT